MAEQRLARGESRMLEPLPCPPDWYHHPNEYWLLRRSARRLIERNADTFWKHPERLETVIEAFQLLRSIADSMPAKPSKAWEQYGHGIVREICCPVCEEIFVHTGNMFVPRCPSCKSFLNERNPKS